MLSVALIAQDTKNKIPIKNINFYGIEKVGTTTVRKWFGLKKNDSFNSDALHKNVMALLQAYAEDGRPYSRLDSLRYTILQDNSGAVIDVYVREGEKIKTGDFTFKGLDDYQLQKVKDEILIRSGRNFDAKKLERDVDRMITRLEKEGHPFAKFFHNCKSRPL